MLTVRMVALSSEPDVFDILARYAQDPRWAVQEETSVYKDGQVVGLYGSLSASPGVESWNLRYEWIGEGPGTRELLA